MADTDRVRERLKRCLQQLLADLKSAQDGVSQVMTNLVDEKTSPQRVSVSHMMLSGYMEDFSSEINELLSESPACSQPGYSTALEHFPATSQHVRSTVATAKPDMGIHTVADSRFTEILERVSVLEKLEAETTLYKVESRKAQQEFSQQLDSVHRQQEDCQEVVDLMSKVVLGSQEGRVVPMDLPAICDWLEKLQSDEEASQERMSKTEARMQQLGDKVQQVESKVKQLQTDRKNEQERISHIETETKQLGSKVRSMENRVMDSVEEGMADVRKETQAVRDELVSTRTYLIEVQQSQQKQAESLANLETKTNQRINKLDNKLKKESESFKAETKDMDKLRRVLNRCHFQAQQRKEQQEQMAELTNWVGTLEKKIDDENKTHFKSTINMSGGKLKKGDLLDKTVETFYNHGNGMRIDARFITPQSGYYHVGLNVHQKRQGVIDLGVVRNELGTSSCFGTRTTQDDEQMSTASVLKLDQGDLLDVLVYEAEGEAVLERCVLFGYRIG